MRWLESLGVFRAAPDPRSRAEIEADLEAEIEHHLEETRARLVAEGLPPATAAGEADRRFGNAVAVRRECLHIRIGERIMLQRLHFAATAAFALACLWLGYENRVQRLQTLRALDEVRIALAGALAGRAPDPATPLPVDEIILQVGDELLLSLPEIQLHERQQVALDGRVLLPDAGWVRVAGLTRPEAEALVTERLLPYYVLPGGATARIVVTRDE